jgi:hypothetical protein
MADLPRGLIHLKAAKPTVVMLPLRIGPARQSTASSLSHDRMSRRRRQKQRGRHVTVGEQDDDVAPVASRSREADGATHDLMSIGNRDALRELLKQADRARTDAARAAAAAKQRKPRRRR